MLWALTGMQVGSEREWADLSCFIVRNMRLASAARPLRQ
jgi:hypothetical protein